MGQRIKHSLTALRDRLAVPAGATVLALLVGLFIIGLMGFSPMVALRSMWRGAFGDGASLGETVVKMTPIICTGLSFAMASRCGLVNIGAEGQLYMGGLASMAIALYVKGLPAVLHIPLCLIAGIIGGGLWGALAGYMKVRFRTNEIISTIMLNYIANYFINYMVSRVMTDPAGTKPQTAIVEPTAMIGRLFDGNRMHWGIFIALLCVLFYYFYLWRLRTGFETRVVGLNPEAAKYAGIRGGTKILIAMFLSGAFAGLAGTIELLAVQQRMYMNFSSGYGFDGIAVALLGQNSPGGILLSAFLFGALRAGSNLMQMNTNVPAAMVSIIQSLVILFVVGSSYFSNRLAKRQIVKQARKDG